MTTNPKSPPAVSTNHKIWHRRLKEGRASALAAGLPESFRLPFATCFSYSPRGESEVSQRSRQLCTRVKNGSVEWIKSYAVQAAQEAKYSPELHSFLKEAVLLTPVPDCNRLTTIPSWSAGRVAEALHCVGVGTNIWTGLRRIKSVEKSTSAWMWERPTVQQHYESFAVIPMSTPPQEILLVDDVITKGRTLIAAAMKLQRTFPEAQIRAFALVRTMGMVLEIPRLLDPCIGAIEWNGADACRDP